MPNDTSYEQYKTLVERGVITDQQAHVFWGYLHYSGYSQPVTDSEMATALHKDDVYFVRRRRNELYKAGVLESVGKRMCTITGITCHVWRVVAGVTWGNFRGYMITWREDAKKTICPTCGGSGKIIDVSDITIED